MAIKVLITAGPTWVPIDPVRVISNTATGHTGILLAREFLARGARVTLILGPGDACCLDKKIRLVRFKFFRELKDLLLRELRAAKYDIVIHSAAVADYCLARPARAKIGSGKKALVLRLKPAPKILDLIRKADKKVFLVAFKFETEKAVLITRARKLLQRSGADLAVANTVRQGKYTAYLVERGAASSALTSKAAMVKKLIHKLSGAR